MSMEGQDGMILTGKIEELGGKPVRIPLCPPQITHGQTRARTRAFADRPSQINKMIPYFLIATACFCPREMCKNMDEI
jgi:hypothetical protein